MYSGEATVTNDQLEGVLKAGDILRVRGLWRSNTSSKKENIQSNNQKVDRDKREQQPVPGQIQKIKLVQPSTEKVIQEATTTPQPVPVPPTAQPIITATTTATTTMASTTIPSPVPPVPTLPEKTNDKPDEILINADPKKITEEAKNNEQIKNKENVENVKKKRSKDNETDSNKSRSEVGDGELNLGLLVKDEPIDWEESMDPTESLTIDHDIDIKPVSIHIFIYK